VAGEGEQNGAGAAREAGAIERPAVGAGIAFRVVGDEMIAYDAAKDRSVVLNASAAAILARCDGTLSADDIAHDLAAELAGSPPDATEQILATVNRLRAMGLVAP
jgi:PqqD family protein of HPr-rel-A system